MRYLKSSLLAAALSLMLSPVAFASSVDAKVTVTSLPTSAALSIAGQPAQVAYQIQVENVSGHDTLKILTLRGSTKVTTLGLPAGPGVTANFVAGPAYCAAPSLEPHVVECPINVVLAPLSAPLNFVVVFSTPTAGDTIKFSTRTKYAEYESGETYVEPEDIESISKTAYTSLVARNGSNAATYLQNGGLVRTSTAASSSATPADNQTTVLDVPTGQATPVSISESTESITCSSALFAANKCFVVRTTIAGNVQFLGPYLRVFLRIDASELAGSTSSYSILSSYKPKPPSINNAVIDYQHVEAPIPSTVIQLQNCSKDKYGNLRIGLGYINPQPGLPCIYKRSVLPKTNPDDKGDWLFEVWTVDNGRLQIR
mgnify:CR=1 FL=1